MRYLLAIQRIVALIAWVIQYDNIQFDCISRWYISEGLVKTVYPREPFKIDQRCALLMVEFKKA